MIKTKIYQTNICLIILIIKLLILLSVALGFQAFVYLNP